MRHRYENWVEGLNGDWLVSRQRFFGVPGPGVVPRSTPTASPTTTIRCSRPRTIFRSIRRPTCRPGTRPISATSPAASPATPTSSTRGRRHRSRQQIAGVLGGASSDLFDRVFPMDMRPQAPRHHPHVAVRHRRAQPLRAPHVAPWSNCALVRVDPRPRPQEDVEVEGQRRHADGSVRRIRHRRRALLGALRPARAPTPRSARTR